MYKGIKVYLPSMTDRQKHSIFNSPRKLDVNVFFLFIAKPSAYH